MAVYSIENTTPRPIRVPGPIQITVLGRSTSHAISSACIDVDRAKRVRGLILTELDPKTGEPLVPVQATKAIAPPPAPPVESPQVVTDPANDVPVIEEKVVEPPPEPEIETEPEQQPEPEPEIADEEPKAAPRRGRRRNSKRK